MIRTLIDCIGGPTIVILFGGAISSLGAIWAAFDQNSSAKKIEAKNEEISRLSHQIANSITGGDSFCYLMPLSGERANQNIVLVASGKFPLYDISARIVDLDRFHEAIKSGESARDLAFLGKNLHIGNLAAGLGQLLSPGLPLQGERGRWNVFLSARNGEIAEEIRARKVGPTWKFAVRVWRQTGQPPVYIYENVDPEYPRESDGSINWE